jgi:preprotein translocase subunit SecG
MTWGQFLLAVLLVFVSVLMILVVLVQRGRGTGLAGAFGGAGSSAFGAKTGDVLTWITCGFAAVFFLLAVVANHAFDYSSTPETLVEPPIGAPAPSGGAVPIPVTPGADGTITIPAEALQSGAPIQVTLPSEGPTDKAAPAGAGSPGDSPAPTPPAAEQPVGESKPAGSEEKPAEDKPSP